jgi:hypothetical protein
LRNLDVHHGHGPTRPSNSQRDNWNIASRGRWMSQKQNFWARLNGINVPTFCISDHHDRGDAASFKSP